MVKLNVLIAATLCAGGVQAEPCRQALALGLDISGSVDSSEYQMQLDGIVGALAHPDVQNALFGQPGTSIDLMIYEWSGPQVQTVLSNWTPLATPTDLAPIYQRLKSTTRSSGDISTAIGSAVEFGASALDTRTCWQHTLDISADGIANTGPLPQTIRKALPKHITVNALLIGDVGESGALKSLTSYFQANVIHGPAGFVETANGYQDYQAALVRKLIKELESISVSHLAPKPQH